MLGRIIVGTIFTLIGFVFVWKTEWFLYNFGRIGFAEQHLGGEGGSRLAYKLIGTIIIIGALLYMTNQTEPILRWFFKTVFRIQPT
ncbi:MAG: hypothetical protein C3F02_04170 [Parcubacteria group bacterium]|nr:MAG: hypothetical protein C3F02_04170 [Parcubacteria group bacterium]